MKQKRMQFSENDVVWEVWFQDMFDRECPREAVVSGMGLVEGLIELWSRHLYETVRENGTVGFSRFNLWLNLQGRSIEVTGSLSGAVKLREWVFRDSASRYHGNTDLLASISEAHGNQIAKDEGSEGILTTAEESKSLDEFRMRLIQLNR